MKIVVLKENEKKGIKIGMVCVIWPLDICLVILRICTCEHYAITLQQNTSK